MPDDFDAALARIRGEAPTAATGAASTPDDFDTALANLRAASGNPRMAGPDPPPVLVGDKQKPEGRGEFLSGGFVSDAFDVLSAGQYAAAGLATGKGIVKGVKERTSFEEVLQQGGMEEGWGRTLAGIGLDIALDPAWVLTPAKAAGVLGKIGFVKKAAEAAEATAKGSKIGRALGKTFVYGFDTPKDILRLSRETRREVAMMETAGKKLMEDIHALGPTATEPMAMFLEHADEGIRNSARHIAVESGVDGAKFQSAAERAVELEKKIKDMSVKEGLKYKGFSERGLRREYKTGDELANHIEKLRATGDAQDLAYADDLQKVFDKEVANPRLGTGPHKKLITDDLPKDVRERLGEITDVGYRVARDVQVGARAAHEARFLNNIGAKYAVEASEGIKRGYKLLPSQSRLGALGGKYVPEGIKDFVMSTIDQESKIPGFWRKAVGYWKAGKVVLSPAGHARNMISNPLLLNFAGVPMHEIPQLYGEAISAWRAAIKGPEALAEFAGKHGLAGPEMAKLAEFINAGGTSNIASEEIGKILADMNVGGKSLLSKLKGPIDAGIHKASTVYAAQEQVSKIAAGIHAIKKTGADFHAAADFGEKAIFDYGAVPKLVKTLRESGVVPFASFGYFASGATARALWSRPAAIGKIGKAFRGIEAHNPNAQAERAAAPEWMKDFGQVFTGVKDRYGRSLVFDASYMLPWAEIANVAERGPLKTALSLTPFVTFVHDVARNQSSFTGRPIAPPESLTGNAKAMKDIATSKYIDYIYKFMLPTWAPSLLPGFPEKMQMTSGGYAWRDIEQAQKARPDVFGDPPKNPRAQSPKAAAFGALLGLKTRPFVMSQELQYRAKELKDNSTAIRSQMKKVAMDAELSAEQKQALFSKLRDDLINVHRAFMVHAPEK